MIDTEQLQREDMRWKILQCLKISGILLMREAYIWKVLNDLEFFPSIVSLRVELNYLEQKGLIKNVRKELPLGSEWMCQLTANGVDFVEYATVEDLVGIARPRR